MLLRTADPVVIRALERVAASAALRLIADEDPGDDPDLVVIDLDSADALGLVRALRDRFTEAFFAGHTAVPRRDVWVEAEHAGCDLIANRGSFATQLIRRLPAPGQPRRRRQTLADAADLPGRIGVVARVSDSPVGPVALYQVKGRLCAVQDSCPHAGATLSTGELEGMVITCPGHGSRFDVCTGERLRGPADSGLRTFEVAEEGGSVYLLWRPEEP